MYVATRVGIDTFGTVSPCSAQQSFSFHTCWDCTTSLVAWPANNVNQMTPDTAHPEWMPPMWYTRAQTLRIERGQLPTIISDPALK